VILDSCFSGAFAEGLLMKDDGSVNIREQLGGEGRAILTSSSSTQYSFEQDNSDLSIYTRYLIEGISTGAADQDEDGIISIDELHEYASAKVREFQPTMKPEIYAIREGFKIRLTKVALGDPRQKYRKEVARYVKRGEISFVGRQTLDVLKVRLGLSEAEAALIEEEILAVPRQQFSEKLQQYEQAFTRVLENEVTSSPEELNTLRLDLQQMLGLRNEDTISIEKQVNLKVSAYKQHLQQYKQILTEALQQQYPLSPATREQMQQIQQDWQLKNQDVATIESRVTAEIEQYRQKLQQYEQIFIQATQQHYPLNPQQQQQLQQQQQSLSLKDEDIAVIESRITAQLEEHHQKLQQYQQVVTQVIQNEYPFGEAIRGELERFELMLGLGDEEVAAIEERVIQQRERNQLPPSANLHRQIPQQPVPPPQPVIVKTTSSTINLKNKWLIGITASITLILALPIAIFFYQSSQITSKPLSTTPAPYPAVPSLNQSGEVDYKQLETLLADGKWPQADQETTNIMLKLAQREQDNWLDAESVNNFPCDGFRKLDRLWVKYSNGRFGFTVQKRIWDSLTGTSKTEQFGQRVGWYNKNQGKWLTIAEIQSPTTKTDFPLGHFPTVKCHLHIEMPEEQRILDRMQRIQTCKL
jgi:hypothetical protein